MATEPLDRVIVTIDDVHTETIQQVADALKLAGLRITSVLPVAGIITGEVAADKFAGLLQISGVVEVEPDSEMQTSHRDAC